MHQRDAGSVFLWSVLLLVFVGLPALLRRYQVRAWQRNRARACGRCGASLESSALAYTEGFRVCPSCAKTVRVRSIVGAGFIGLITLATIILSLFAMATDARAGDPDPWWAYVLMMGVGVGLVGLFWFVVSKARNANKRAALRDAALVRRYDTGEE